MNARLNQIPRRFEASRRHVDLPTGLELITVHGLEKPQIVCPLWPECGCTADCTAGAERAGRAQRVAVALICATAIIGAGLLYFGLR